MSAEARKLLEQAAHLVGEDRRHRYGDAGQVYEPVARLWSAYLETPVTAADVMALMALLKLGRHLGGNKTSDNYIDAAGYCALLGDLATRGS